ncbi:MAG TPA: SusC/RagA family TonB-linked outer membrane protein [Flavitalea sp.]|nr:SusC/RagA family TonB-linked outer membrane protein [Flavitalea sp.]
MRKFLSLLLVGLLYSALSFGQAKVISGKITDKQGVPVPFVTVTVKGEKRGTSADVNGQFSISAKKGDVLVVSGTDRKTTEVVVGDESTVTVAVDQADKVLDEVIVTAGGLKTRRKEVGSASTVVKAEALVAGKAVNVAGGLQGKVAGLQISATNGGVNPNYRLILRGQRSLTGNNQALLVLDNVIVPSDVLGNLNPEDVEDVTVLNGAGAAALYGSQASNGALIVTTKKGKKGSNTVTVANTTTIEQTAFFPKFQEKFGSGGTAYGYGSEFNYLENQSYGDAFDGSLRPLGPPLEDGSQDSAIYAYNPGHLKFWETGVTNQTDVALSSGDDNSTFYLSGQYVTTTGTTPGDKYNRTSLRANGTRKIGKKLMITYTTAYTQNRYDITTQTGSMYANMLNMPSHVDITKYKNWKTDKFANPIGFYNPWYQNPYFTADNNRSLSRNDYLTGNVELRFTPIKGLDFIARQGVATRNFSNKNTVGKFVYTEYSKNTDQSSKADISASVQDGSGYTTNLLSDLLALYNTKWDKFSLSAVAGGQWRQDEFKSVNVGANGLVVPDLYNVSNGVGTPDASEFLAKARQMGVYGKITLGYNGYLFLTATGRNDWVSTLSPDNRSFFYPSVEASFLASEAIEAIKFSNVISFLKFRGGWSKVGQVNLGGAFGAYQLLPTFSSGSGFPFGSLPGYSVGNSLVSNNLNPEMTRSYEFGFDLNLLHDRFTSNVTFYKSKTDDQTVNTSVSNSTGFTGLRTNTGQTLSSGLEVTASYAVISNRDWNVRVGANYTYLDNKVNFINSQLPRLALSTYGSSAGSYAVAGEVFPVIMGFDYKRDDQGRVIVNDITGLPSKADTISILGNAVAKHKLGVNFNVDWKRFSFSMLWEYRGDYQVYNSMGSELDWSGTGYRTAVYDRKSFVFPNSVYFDGSKYVENKTIAIANGNGNNGFWTDAVNREVNSNYVTSGDFWKLREVSLSYEIPGSAIGKSNVLKGINVSVQARNLLLLMARDNYYTDPEFSDGGNDTNGIGLTGLTSPPSRFYGATVKFRF